MISHISIGVLDLAKAGRFYDAALAGLGCKRLYDSAEALGYGAESPELWVMKVERPVKADEASGLHLCFDAADRAGVDAFHKAGIKAGDRLLSIDGRWTENVLDCYRATASAKPGSEVPVVIRRDSKEMTLTVRPRAGL